MNEQPECSAPGWAPALYLDCFFTEHSQLVCSVVSDRPEIFDSSQECAIWHHFQLRCCPVDIILAQLYNQCFSRFCGVAVTATVSWEQQMDRGIERYEYNQTSGGCFETWSQTEHVWSSPALLLRAGLDVVLLVVLGLVETLNNFFLKASETWGRRDLRKTRTSFSQG